MSKYMKTRYENVKNRAKHIHTTLEFDLEVHGAAIVFALCEELDELEVKLDKLKAEVKAWRKAW